MINPYQSPTPSEPEPRPSRSSVLRPLFFVLNFAVAVLLFAACVLAAAAAETPYAYLGGVLAFPPVLVYGICEWLAFYRSNRVIERGLGYANLGCAAFVAFGAATTFGEVAMADGPPDRAFLFWSTLIGCLLAAYLVASGWCRLRWTRDTARNR